MTTPTTSYPATVQAKWAMREDRLRSATGWLSLVGKAFLPQGPTVIGAAESAPARLPAGAPDFVGTVHVAGNVARFVAADGVDVRLGDAPIKERVLVSDREGRADALVVAGGIVLELMERGDTLALRIRDTRVLPRPFAGIDRFPISAAWRVAAFLEPWSSPKTVELDFEGSTGPVNGSFESAGTLVFTHSGAEHRLEALYEDASRRRLFVLFRDATAGSDSYALGRLVYTPLPDDKGVVDLDFNLTLIPGCAFTIFATCPIPAPHNRLLLPIPAGERFYKAPPIGE